MKSYKYKLDELVKTWKSTHFIIEAKNWKFKVDWYLPIWKNLVLKTSAKLGFLGLYNSYSNQFTTEDVQELKDVYQDIIEDLDLYDNTFQVLGVNDATFQEPRRYEGKMCKIFIRTIVTDLDTKELPSDEEMSNHLRVSRLLQTHLERIKNMGYVVEVKSKFNDVIGFALIINGLIIVITKKRTPSI